MTREEAIQILSTRDAHGVLCGYTSGVTEALDMAVEALRFAKHFDLLKEYQSLQEVVRCKDCRKQGSDDCPMFNREWRTIMRGGECVDDFIFHDLTKPSGFCNYGERREP